MLIFDDDEIQHFIHEILIELGWLGTDLLSLEILDWAEEVGLVALHFGKTYFSGNLEGNSCGFSLHGRDAFLSRVSFA